MTMMMTIFQSVFRVRVGVRVYFLAFLLSVPH